MSSEKSIYLEALQVNIAHLADQREFFETYFLFRHYKVTMGGYRTNKPTFFKAGEYSNGIRATKDYHTETSFSPEQTTHVSRCLGYLYALVSGKLHGEEPEQTIPLSQRIQNRYIPQASFESAVFYGFLDVLAEFGDKYPSLTPVLQALYGSGGSRATFNAIGNSQMFLNDAIKGELTHENKKEHGNITRHRFIGRSLSKKKTIITANMPLRNGAQGYLLLWE